ncbi:hypothetical protein V496_00602 [Pseudogymnoascus sp. VKM F-4515 (FW-2607)]|nr:hypothetical protein V496_00602 [Pseudogymnoascus sp. VKM F-4515 (FW-2607)]
MAEVPETKVSVAKFAWPGILRFKHGALSNRHKIYLLANAVASILLVSAGAAMHILHRGSLATFCVNTLAIVPTSTLVSHSTRQLVVKLQQRDHEFLSGLINAIFGLASLIIPAAFKIFSDAGESGLVAISRGGAVVLLVIFGSYLYWFYYTHRRQPTIESLPTIGSGFMLATMTLAAQSATPIRLGDPESTQLLLQLRKASLENKSDKLSYVVHITLMIITSFMMVLSSIFMLEAFHSPYYDLGLSKSFVGLVIVPIVIGAAEHVATALRAKSRRKEEIEWIIEFAISSSIRTTLFILPLAVILGWILNVPEITLFFDGFQVTLLTLAILLVNYVVHGGMAHWLEGVMLIGAYVLFANAAWRYPNEA